MLESMKRVAKLDKKAIYLLTRDWCVNSYKRASRDYAVRTQCSVAEELDARAVFQASWELCELAYLIVCAEVMALPIIGAFKIRKKLKRR